MISFAPRLTSFRRAASSTMRRNSPSSLSVSPCAERSIDLPMRSRPSRKLPSHSPAASCADSQLNYHRAASPSRKGWSVVSRWASFGKSRGCGLCRNRGTTSDNPSDCFGHLFCALPGACDVGHLFRLLPISARFSGIFRPCRGYSGLGHLLWASHNHTPAPKHPSNALPGSGTALEKLSNVAVGAFVPVPPS